MDTTTTAATGGKRKPVPAGGAPTPATIEAADATPPATDTTDKSGEKDDTPSGSEPSTTASGPEPSTTTDTRSADVSAPAATDPVAKENAIDLDAIVEARVLIAFDGYEVNDIITDTVRAIGTMKLAGQVDPHPDAVAYALSL